MMYEGTHTTGETEPSHSVKWSVSPLYARKLLVNENRLDVPLPWRK
jgi:hypothetical protein